jgi:hypothetical protein
MFRMLLTFMLIFTSAQAAVVRQQSWVAHRLFWFAWYSFHPDTLLRTGDYKTR